MRNCEINYHNIPVFVFIFHETYNENYNSYGVVNMTLILVCLISF